MEAEFYQAGHSKSFLSSEFVNFLTSPLCSFRFLDAAAGITAWTHRSQSDTHRDPGQGAIVMASKRTLQTLCQLCQELWSVLSCFEFLPVRYPRSLEPTKEPHSMEVRPAHISWKLGEQQFQSTGTKSFPDPQSCVGGRFPTFSNQDILLRTHNSMRGLELTLASATRNASMTFESLAKQVPYFVERCSCFGTWWTCAVHTDPYHPPISFVFEYVFLIDTFTGAFVRPAWAPRQSNAVPQEAILRVRAFWESGCVPSKARCSSHSFWVSVSTCLPAICKT